MTINEALRLTRNEAGKSQEFMALEMEVSRRTIQHWETGVSEPTIGQAVQWFQLVHKNPIPFLLQYLFPSVDRISSRDDDEKLRKALMELISDFPPEGVRQLLFFLYGNHGSSPRAVLHLITAHLQTPLKDRVTQAGLIIHNYEIAKKRRNLNRPDHIQPDLDVLKSALAAGEAAVIQDGKEYLMKD